MSRDIKSSIDWIANGEDPDATVFNRPLDQFLSLIENNSLDLPSYTTVVDGVTFEGGIVDGDFVYKNTGTSYGKAVADGTIKENVVGVADVTRGELITSGIVSVTDTLIVGTVYYLGNITPGTITDVSYSGAVKVGVAVSTSQLLLDIDKSPSGSELSEALEYEFLLNSSPFKFCYFDTFDETGSFASTTSTYNATTTAYDGESGNTATTGDILSGNSTPYYRGYVSFNTENDLITAEYSFNGSSWNPLPSDQFIENGSGYVSLYLRFSWSGTDSLKSFGFLYDDVGFSTTSKTRIRERYTATGIVTSGSNITLPNGMKYTLDDKSLKVVHGSGLELVRGVHFNEVNNSQIEILFDLESGDILDFSEDYGYIDISFENKSRMDTEHDAVGFHIYTDVTTSIQYKFQINNGNIELVEL